MKRIEVAVGIVFDQENRVLVGQRTVKDQYFEKWEFPGGKLEADESAEAALIREFKEEVGIEILSIEYLMQLDHDYPDRQVSLNVYTINHYQGEIKAMEGQALRWVSSPELNDLDFLTGNQAIVEALRGRLNLPSCIKNG